MLKDMDQRSPILGLQERRDFDKFLKFFSLKAVQVIVQSRNGDRASTSSKPPAVGQHWFNLAIEDIPEITVETKKTMEGRLPSQEHSMCIEISLKTNEGDSMVLETWCLGMNNRLDSHAKITYTVYNRMGMLLKSLVSVTRITPAYKLSRKQGIDYEICYRIYFGDVKVSELGEGFQTIHVGAVGSPVGSVTLSAAYRTNLSMAERQPTMPVKSDHYSSQDRVRYDSEGPWEIPIPCAPTGTQAQLHVGAGVRHVAEEIANASETEVTSPSNRFTSNQSPIPNRPSSYQKSSGVSTPLDITKAHHTKGAFASSPVTADIPSNLPALSSTPPFASLLNNKNSLGSRPDTPENKRPHRNSLNLSNRKDSSTESSDSKQPPSNVTRSLWGNDDGFVLVELKPAFASPSGADGDLGSFYRECQKAPPLMMFDDKRQQTLNDVMDELDQELSSYNECLPVFDELVANLKISQSS